MPSADAGQNGFKEAFSNVVAITIFYPQTAGSQVNLSLGCVSSMSTQQESLCHLDIASDGHYLHCCGGIKQVSAVRQRQRSCRKRWDIYLSM